MFGMQKSNAVCQKSHKLDFRKLCLFVDLLTTGGQGHNTNKRTRPYLPLGLNARKIKRLYNEFKQSYSTLLTQDGDVKLHAA